MRLGLVQHRKEIVGRAEAMARAEAFFGEHVWTRADLGHNLRKDGSPEGFVAFIYTSVFTVSLVSREASIVES